MKIINLPVLISICCYLLHVGAYEDPRSNNVFEAKTMVQKAWVLMNPIGSRSHTKKKRRIPYPSSWVQSLTDSDHQEWQKMQPLRIILCGPPASGKGTQAQKLQDTFDLVHLSAGDMLREAVSKGTKLGKQAEKYMRRGDLVPDELVIALIKAKIEELEKGKLCRGGWILDGFPRTAEQAKALMDLLLNTSELEIDPENLTFVNLQVPDAAVVRRISGRRIDPLTNQVYHLEFSPPPEDDAHLKNRLIQRLDDSEEFIWNRIRNFHGNVNSIREYLAQDLQSMLWVDIDGTKSPEEVFAKISTSIKTRRVVCSK